MEVTISAGNSVAEFLKELDLNDNFSTHSNLNEQIEVAKKRLLNTPLPNRRQEEWKYSKITPWLRKQYSSFCSNDSIDLHQFEAFKLNTNVLVFVNGFFRDDLSIIS
jgi:hypothetical protein